MVPGDRELVVLPLQDFPVVLVLVVGPALDAVAAQVTSLIS